MTEEEKPPPPFDRLDAKEALRMLADLGLPETRYKHWWEDRHAELTRIEEMLASIAVNAQGPEAQALIKRRNELQAIFDASFIDLDMCYYCNRVPYSEGHHCAGSGVWQPPAISRLDQMIELTEDTTIRELLLLNAAAKVGREQPEPVEIVFTLGGRKITLEFRVVAVGDEPVRGTDAF